MLRGIYTARAADQLRAAGVDLGVVATVALEELSRIDGTDGVASAVVTADGTSTACDSVVVTSRRAAPRDLLARMVNDPRVQTVGPRGRDLRATAVPDCGRGVPVFEGHRR
jgi:hypothetical protein